MTRVNALPPKPVHPSEDTSWRDAAKEADPTSGAIEPGADTYVLDQVAAWAGVGAEIQARSARG
jgi:hypothetical protein